MPFITAMLLAVYFFFFLQHIGSEPFFSRIGRFVPTFYDFLAVGFLVYLGSVYVYRSKKFKSERLTKIQIFWCVNIFLFFSFVALVSHLYDDQNKTPAITITVGYLATLGWIYTNYMNMRSQQRAHTMNVLMQLRTNAVLNEHRINIFRKFPAGTPLTEADMPALKAEKKNPASYNITSSSRATAVADSIQYMANLYEFICIGMRQGDLDEAIIRMSLRGIIVSFHKHLKPYIDDSRLDESGMLLPEVYENLLFYVERFSKK